MDNKNEIQKGVLEAISKEIPSDITIRTGEALPIERPKNIEVTGEIYTPVYYLNKRAFDKEKTYAIIHKSEFKIILIVGEESQYGRKEITGILERGNVPKTIGINTGEFYSIKEIVKVLRLNRRFFPNQNKFNALILQLSGVESKISIENKSSNDNRGNKTADFMSKLESNIMSSFEIKAPLFKGFEPQEINVDVLLDYTANGSLFIAFDSIDLIEKTETIGEKILQDVEDQISAHSIFFTSVY